jgi:hypothetical protein
MGNKGGHMTDTSCMYVREIPRAVHNDLKKIAIDKGITLNRLVLEILITWITVNQIKED